MRTLAVLAFALLMILYAAAFGAEAPAFPFDDARQFLNGTPEIVRVGPPRDGNCGGFPAMVFRYAAATDPTKEILWAVMVRMDNGNDFTVAYFGHESFPQFIYAGIVNANTGALTIGPPEPYEDAKHARGCERWKPQL